MVTNAQRQQDKTDENHWLRENRSRIKSGGIQELHAHVSRRASAMKLFCRFASGSHQTACFDRRNRLGLHEVLRHTGTEKATCQLIYQRQGKRNFTGQGLLSPQKGGMNIAL